MNLQQNLTEFLNEYPPYPTKRNLFVVNTITYDSYKRSLELQRKDYLTETTLETITSSIEPQYNGFVLFVLLPPNKNTNLTTFKQRSRYPDARNYVAMGFSLKTGDRFTPPLNFCRKVMRIMTVCSLAIVKVKGALL